ncbi:expressed protein [Arabidopsis lyrata subsp. lyrata]|uniref:Expressed protein n=1 Tax=Arabidopsis lyrata subsp. lyrata TaxID=81972 RepID=D7M3U8_ARALL|nr:expressed protein [Arabidopsis lyrata subsp. lyrata]
MAIHWISTTVSFSPLLESVISAISVILIGIIFESTVSGKHYSSPRVIFIILSMGWCVFVLILGVSQPKIEWRYIYRIFIILLLMEENWYRRLFKMTLGIAGDMKNLEPKDCTFDMDLMEERHGFWHYGLSMEVMEEKCSKEIKAYANFTENFFETWALLLAFDLNEKGNIAEALEELVTFMEKLKPILRTFGSKEICKIITKNLTGKKLCGYVGENYRVRIFHYKDLGTEVLVPLCLRFRITYTHVGLKAAVCKNKVQPSDAAFKSYQRKANMKLDNNRSYDRLASKAILRKASSNSLLLYFSQYIAHTSAYVIICVTVILHNIFVITL